MQILELLAALTSAAFGVLLARSKQMDFVGVLSLAFILAFGGGTLRDVLLGRQPLFWIEHEHYAWAVFGIAVVGTLLPRVPERFVRWLNLPDAVALGLYSIVGASVAIEVDTFPVSPFIASLFAVITGTFGGVIADIICNDVPRLFRPTTTLYASCAFVGAWVYLLLRQTSIGEGAALSAGVSTVVATRLLALRFDLRLPATKE